MQQLLTLSPLGHTWLIDLDGCVLEHNGHLRGKDVLLPGVREFWSRIPKQDTIVLLISRAKDQADTTRKALQGLGLRYDRILFGLPFGERIVINDQKPSGLKTAHAINLARDTGPSGVNIKIDTSL